MPKGERISKTVSPRKPSGTAGKVSPTAVAELSRLGAAKIGGLVCNKKSPMKVRIDLDVPAKDAEKVWKILGKKK